MKTSARAVARYGLLTALALILSYLEAQIPVFFAVPGMKLGLANLAVVTALYLSGAPCACVVSLVRVLLVSVLFGNGAAFAYSLAGSVLSAAVMILLKRTGRFGPIAVSAAGGVAHVTAQLAVAAVLMGTSALGWYLPVLWFAGVTAGAVIGLIGGELCRALQRLKWGEDRP
ncbi:MAG: Gx transporter family protein [Oscillospiraceae bacterium]|nr:Gx transporter family protein [Oscillospiraceae bacterium]